MEKVTYYKKMKKGKNICYSRSLGEPLDVELPNGKIMHLACEFYRGDGWRITDRDTRMVTQNKHMPSKKVLTEYIKDKGFLTAFERTQNTEYYKKQKDELKQFFENKARPTSL